MQNKIVIIWWCDGIRAMIVLKYSFYLKAQTDVFWWNPSVLRPPKPCKIGPSTISLENVMIIENEVGVLYFLSVH